MIDDSVELYPAIVTMDNENRKYFLMVLVSEIQTTDR